MTAIFLSLMMASGHKITDLTDEGAIERELALFKVSAPPERRSEVSSR